MPLGFRYGLQVDGMVGSGKGAAFYGVGGHLFWRDPAKGLLGLYGSYVSWDASGGLPGSIGGADVGKVGVEGEAYFGRLSLEGLAAYQFGTFTGFAGKALLAYYPTDDLRLDGGVRYLEGPGAIGMIEAEWQPHAGSGLDALWFRLFRRRLHPGAGRPALLLRRYRQVADPPAPRGRSGDRGRKQPAGRPLRDGDACPAGTHVFTNDAGSMCVPRDRSEDLRV